MTAEQACWEHIKTMRQTDRNSILTNDPICLDDGVLQSYWSTAIEWETDHGLVTTKVEYTEDDDGLYCAYHWKGDYPFGNMSEEPTLSSLASEIDALVRQERIDQILN